MAGVGGDVRTDGGDEESVTRVPLGRRSVTESYRIRIPVDDLGLDDRERIDVLVDRLDVDGDGFAVTELPVKSGRITIPYYQRQRPDGHPDVEVGEEVAVTVFVPAGDEADDE